MQQGIFRNFLFKLLIPGFFLAFCLPAYAADWQPILQDGKNKGYRQPNDTFRIFIPPEVPIAELQRLALEFDNIDITAMVSRDGNYAIYKSPQPLATGYHQLRVVEYLSNGSIKELGAWRFEVRQSELFREYAFAANTQLTVNQRIADKNLTQPVPSRLQGQGSSQVAFAVANGDWNAKGQFDLIYNSLKRNTPNRRTLDNGEFLFSVGNANTDARIGHQTVGSRSLIMNNFRRRGISVERRFSQSNTSVAGFSLASDNIIGFRRGLGISDSRKRVYGVTFDSSPLTDTPKKLHFSGTWLNGEGRNSSSLIARDPSTLVASVDASESGSSSGSAFSMSVDGLLMKDRLQLRAEYAGSDYDFNTTDNFSSESDNAYSLSAIFSDTTTSGMNWNAGVENNKVGTFFKSLANLSLPTDQWLLHVFAGSQWPNFGIQGDYQKLKDNVNDIAILPEIETDIGNVTINWAPKLASNDGWMGSPNFSVLYSRQTQNQNSTPVSYVAARTDNELDNWQANAIFSYPSMNWGIGLASNKFRDHSAIQHDTDTDSINLNSNIILMDRRISLAPSVTYNLTKDLITNQTSTAINYGLQTTMVFKPEKLDASFDIRVNHNYTNDSAISNSTLSANMALNWHLIKAKRNKFGVDIGLTGIYNDINNNVRSTLSTATNALNTFDTYQVFLTFSVVLPTRAGQAQ